MGELETYLETNIPINTCLISLLVLCITIVLILLACKDVYLMRKFVLLAMLMEYVIMVFASTVIYRVSVDYYRFEFIPFYSYYVDSKDEPMLLQVVLNVVLFIPIGLLLRGVITSWKILLMICFAISSSIEILQLVFRKGLCETDDVIHNTLGAIIGCLLYIGISKGIKCLKQS